MSGLLAAGVELMLIGMGTVFVFLTILVFATMLMSFLVQKLMPSEQSRSDVQQEEVAAIAVAIHLHRSEK